MKETPALLGAYGVHFQRKGVTVLSEITVELRAGEVTAFVGPNGCGKTTLLQVLAGWIDFRARGRSGGGGVLTYLGQDFTQLSPAQKAERAVYVGADFSTEFPLTVEEFVGLGLICRSSGVKSAAVAIDDALRDADVSVLRARSVRSLSGGERQRVNLARALLQAPKVLLLDEAFSKMDVDRLGYFRDLLRRLTREGRAIGLVSHDLNFAAETADRCVLMREGRVVKAGALGEIFTRDELALVYPRSELRVAPDPFSGKPKLFY
ncbi:MAG: ABC transporter ATP-binding protein [Bacteriovoracia bacterium]